ncbi:MAG TPA: PAS domain S-box protein [Bryobacteraceae bacterium]|nr:PAS domain S-box protein [Bryobacteraceae bacterium]
MISVGAKALTNFVVGGDLKDSVFRELIQALPVAIYMTDAQGRLTYFNPAAVKLSGRVPELGTDKWCITWRIFLPDGTPLPHDQCPMAMALKGAEVPTGIECIAERPDGTRFWFTPCPAVFRDAEGRILGGINLLMDITDRKNAETEAAEQFRAIVETTPECVKIIAPDGTLLFMNPAGLAMVGAASAADITGRNVYDIIAAEDRDRFREFNESVCRGAKASLQFDVVGFGGARRHMETHAAPLRHHDGATVHLAITHDVTERRQAERAALLLRAVVDSSDDAIVSKNLNGIITSWNKSAERMFGYTAEEGIGQSITMLIPPDRLGEEPEILARLARGERVDHFETVRRRKDGSLLDISLTISPVRDAAEGVIIGASKIARDISERKRVERAGLLLCAIVNSSDDAIISKDLNGIITSWNESAERMFGYTAAEAVGQSVTMLMPADRLEEEPEILARLRRGERVEHFETVRRRKDGALLDISLTISPVRNSKGVIVGASKIARDIGESKRTRAALVASEARFRQLADTMPQIVWTARPDGYIDYYNERWYEYTGFNRNVFGHAGWEAILHPEDVERRHETWCAAINAGQPYNIEYRLKDKNLNRWRWFVGRAVPVRDTEDKVVKWFGTCTDIDEQKRAQEKLRRANDDLEQFAFSASHDLQEPLRTVKIYSELLASRHVDGASGEARQFVTFVRDGATRMEMLVRDLLAFTQVIKMDDPGDEIADANDAVKEALANLAGAIAESRAEISTDPLPAVRVHGMHLQQLFQNLIGNAIKYRSPQRQPIVHVSAERRNAHWIFTVSDNGIGIAPEYKENIFGLFKRLHNSNEYSGTGIGLAICQRIMDRYHGRIWVESEPGYGSDFRFRLPV